MAFLGYSPRTVT